MTTEEILDRAGALAVKAIKDEFDEKGLNDTKRGKESLSHQVTGNTLIISGFARVLFLEYGRKAGKFPPVDVIRGWVERKLGVSPEESKGVAFVIARKIAREGTDILSDRSKGLQIELVINQINTELLKNITNTLSLEITGGLTKIWESEGNLNILE